MLLLDEPTASLDPDTADWARAYLESFQHQTGATILLASHNMAEVERLCDEVVILKAGRLVDRGSAETLIARHGHATLEEVFLDIAHGDGAGAPSHGNDGSGCLTRILPPPVLLRGVMFRSNIGVAVSFLEEMWSRNLAELFASPLRPYEWAISLFCVSLTRTLIGVVPAALLAIPLYHFSIFDMGWAFVAFFMNLMIFGAATGLAVSGLVLRCGLGAESLAWAAIFAIAPISGIYYPISVLPAWIQPVAWALPSAYARRCRADGSATGRSLVRATGYIIILLIFPHPSKWPVRPCRERGGGVKSSSDLLIPLMAETLGSNVRLTGQDL